MFGLSWFHRLTPRSNVDALRFGGDISNHRLEILTEIEGHEEKVSNFVIEKLEMIEGPMLKNVPKLQYKAGDQKPQRWRFGDRSLVTSDKSYKY